MWLAAAGLVVLYLIAVCCLGPLVEYLLGIDEEAEDFS